MAMEISGASQGQQGPNLLATSVVRLSYGKKKKILKARWTGPPLYSDQQLYLPHTYPDRSLPLKETSSLWQQCVCVCVCLPHRGWWQMLWQVVTLVFADSRAREVLGSWYESQGPRKDFWNELESWGGEWVQNNVNGSSEVQICCNTRHILLLFPMPNFCFTCHPQILLLSSLFQLFISLFPFFFCLLPTFSLFYGNSSDLSMRMWKGAPRCSFVLFYAHFNPWWLRVHRE